MRGKYSRKQSGKDLLGGRIRSAEDALKVGREAFLKSTLPIPLLRVKIEDKAHIQYIQSNSIRSKVENERKCSRSGVGCIWHSIGELLRFKISFIGKSPIRFRRRKMENCILVAGTLFIFW